MADVERLKQMAEAVRQRAQVRSAAERRSAEDAFQKWVQTALSPEMQEVLQVGYGWDERRHLPVATFELGRKRARLYQGGADGENGDDKEGREELGSVIITDPDGLETMPLTFGSEDALLLLLEGYV